MQGIGVSLRRSTGSNPSQATDASENFFFTLKNNPLEIMQMLLVETAPETMAEQKTTSTHIYFLQRKLLAKLRAPLKCNG